jgi:hypothetical protein
LEALFLRMRLIPVFKKNLTSGVVVPTYNPSYSGGRDRRFAIQNQYRQSQHDILSEKQA